jgi:hypothetical protein
VNYGQALGPPWTGGNVDIGTLGRGGALIGAWPLATPELESSLAGVEDGEGRTTTPFRGSP